MKTLVACVLGLTGSLPAAENDAMDFSQPFNSTPSFSLNGSTGFAVQGQALSLVPAVQLPPDVGPTTLASRLSPAELEAALPRKDKFIHAPQEGVDYKLIVQASDPSIDYKLKVLTVPASAKE